MTGGSRLMSRRLRIPTFIEIRTAVLFVAGLAGLAYEVLANGTERPTLIIMFGAMMGFPYFLGRDAKLGPEHPPPPPRTLPPPAPSSQSPEASDGTDVA